MHLRWPIGGELRSRNGTHGTGRHLRCNFALETPNEPRTAHGPQAGPPSADCAVLALMQPHEVAKRVPHGRSETRVELHWSNDGLNTLR